MKTFTHSLENGLTIAVEEIPYFKTASIGLWVNVGARFESKEENARRQTDEWRELSLR